MVIHEQPAHSLDTLYLLQKLLGLIQLAAGPLRRFVSVQRNSFISAPQMSHSRTMWDEESAIDTPSLGPRLEGEDLSDAAFTGVQPFGL